MHSWHSSRPPSPPDQQSERVFVLSGLAWPKTLHMMEPTAAEVASCSSVSVRPLVRQSVCLWLDLGSSYSYFFGLKAGSGVNNEDI